ncbi:hypothetical protein Asi02nite_04480 [Asanoa siamensis]|uniref:Uncharacterized protein n=1 Tax=Asanoa siamensis TaxID=926357 RepID=A0ABQ4CI00_9ACTN|nr:hypothetical protein Asi02nite_04480 [Asanoa siamensis]
MTLLLLTAGGATAGWLYGQRVSDDRAAAAGGGSGSGESQEQEQEPEQPVRESCPAATEASAEATGSPGGLVEILFIRTDDDRQVWICRDTAGTLFYQGYVGPADGPFEEGKNALFLTTVEETGGGYLATNRTDEGTTTYSVTPYRLTQTTNGNESTFPVAERRPN